MIKEIRKGQRVRIEDGVCLNADPKPNSKRLFNASRKNWNYNYMGRVEVVVGSSPDHSLTTYSNPKRTNNEFKAIGN